jgi:hypothetical protein
MLPWTALTLHLTFVMPAKAGTQASFKIEQPVDPSSIKTALLMTTFGNQLACLGGRLRGHDG